MLDEEKRSKSLVGEHEIVVRRLWCSVLGEDMLVEINRLTMKEAENQPGPSCSCRFEDDEPTSGLQDPRDVTQHIERPRQMVEDVGHNQVAHAGVGKRELASVDETVDP